MSIHISIGGGRKKPRVGDRKEIRGVLHERQLKRVYDARGNCLGTDHTNGRYHYEWIPVGAEKRA